MKKKNDNNDNKLMKELKSGIIYKYLIYFLKGKERNWWRGERWESGFASAWKVAIREKRTKGQNEWLIVGGWVGVHGRTGSEPEIPLSLLESSGIFFPKKHI